MPGRLFVAFLLFSFSSSLVAQVKPVPDPNPDAPRASKAQKDRVKAMSMKAAKLLLKAKLFREKRKIFGRDNELIAKLEAIVEFDELIEPLIEKKIDEFMSKNANASELGDGALLEKLIAFWSSPEFEQFVTQILRIVERIFELIGPLLMDVKPGPESWVITPFQIQYRIHSYSHFPYLTA